MQRIGDQVGARIKAVRLRQHPPLRLADLAGNGLSLGMLSKIERGRVSPSLTTLQYLAERLGVPLAFLFEEAPETRERTAALGAARAALWLGDPVRAAERALALADALGGVLGGGAPVEGLGEDSVDATADKSGEGSVDGSTGRVRPGGGAAALLRAAALGIAAEALLEADNAASAMAHLIAASAMLRSLPVTPVEALPEGVLGGLSSKAPPGPRGVGVAEGRATMVAAHLSWVLGLLERRRGQTAQAQRSWSHCLELLEGQDGHGAGVADGRAAAGPTRAPFRPPAAVLRARALLELGGLHEALGAWETARNFHARAGAIVRWIADPAAVARSLLAAPAGAHMGPLPSRTGDSRQGAHASTPGGPPQEVQTWTPAVGPDASDETGSAVEVLAAVALARRLAEQVTQSLTRLDRDMLRHRSVSPPEVPHSRHLR